LGKKMGDGKRWDLSGRARWRGGVPGERKVGLKKGGGWIGEEHEKFKSPEKTRRQF